MGKIVTITINAYSVEDLEQTIAQYQTMGFSFHSIVPFKYFWGLGVLELDRVLLVFEKRDKEKSDKIRYEKVV